MPKFSLTSTWMIPAPIDIVWSCLVDTQTWPVWWKYVASVQETACGDSYGLGNIRQYHWRTCLPYSLMLNLRVIDIQPKHLIAVEVSGDLHGDGCCRLEYQAVTGRTRVVFHWRVRTCRPWMERFTTLTRPVYAWNHARVMKLGEQSLIQYLNCRIP